ncbi:hypothetical protein B0T14DRAFT_531946 [Immersiella caudata]|uniref:Uncharacterized protein n=1 Tax=Immersiella caudata TaxID=314043 RepID=A0AA39W9K0_9PEZI|nr:hypothetical protein B0T14DRAFT_531946 [Immersiella caudata]
MSLLNRFHYEKLHGDNQEKKSSLLYRVARCLLPFLATALVLFPILRSWHNGNLSSCNFSNSGSSSPPPVHNSCGSAPSEARSRGCHFDILSFAWQTHECFDAELMDTFIAYDNWTFYTQPNRTSETVDLGTALKGEMSLFVDWKYHVTHCTFMWMQMHRAYGVRGWIDSHLDSYAHTMHCRWALLETGTKMEEVNVVAAVKYPRCRRATSGEKRREESFRNGENGHGVHGMYSL